MPGNVRRVVDDPVNGGRRVERAEECRSTVGRCAQRQYSRRDRELYTRGSCQIPWGSSTHVQHVFGVQRHSVVLKLISNLLNASV